MDLHIVDPRLSLSGLLVGLLVTLTGVGGGAVMTPLLVLVFGINPATAVGTDLWMPPRQSRWARWCTG